MTDLLSYHCCAALSGGSTTGEPSSSASSSSTYVQHGASNEVIEFRLWYKNQTRGCSRDLKEISKHDGSYFILETTCAAKLGRETSVP